MDNKLFKRIVAVAASAVMLTSSAFATVLTVGEDAWNDTAKSLTFSYNPAGATKVTYLAYAAREAVGEETGTEINGTKYVFGEIVAVNQLDGSEVVAEGATLNVPVNSDLLTVGEGEAAVNATHIVLMSGADNSNTADTKVVALTQAPATFAVTIVANDGVVVTEGDVIPANGNYATVTLPVLKKDGFTFKGWSTDGAETGIIANSATANQTVTVSTVTTYTAIFEAVVTAKTVTFVNGATSTTLAVDKLNTLTKPANIKLSDLTLTETDKATTFVLSELAFLGWTTNGTDPLTTTGEVVYLHAEADKPAYEAAGKNPSGVTYKTLSDLATITENITLYAKYDSKYAYGDVNGDGVIAAVDVGGTRSFLQTSGGTVVQKTGKALFPLFKNAAGTKYIVGGDVNADGAIAAVDVGGTRSFLQTSGGTVVQKTGKHIYYINK